MFQPGINTQYWHWPSTQSVSSRSQPVVCVSVWNISCQFFLRPHTSPSLVVDCGGGGRERSWFYHTPINHKTFHPTNALNKDWIESQVELLRNAKVLCMYLLNIVTPHKLCGPLSTEAGGGVVLRRVIVSILKSALILILKLNRSENIKEQRDYTVLCIYSRLVLCWYCIHDEGSPLPTQVENAGKYEDIVATFLRYDQQWKYATVISYTRTHPLVTGIQWANIGIIPDHPQLELETKVKWRFEKVSIVSCSRPSLMIITLASQFHVYLPWGQRPFSIVS